MKRLLIADDDAGMRAALEARFRRQPWIRLLFPKQRDHDCFQSAGFKTASKAF